MAHVRIVASTAVAATVWGWASFGSAIATIAGIGWGMVEGKRKRRSRAKHMPHLPKDATVDQIEEFGVRMDQFLKDEGDS